MNKMLLMVLALGIIVFLGCSEKSISKDISGEVSTAKEDVYGFVIARSIKECVEHNITLNEKRINEFMRRSPKHTIEKAATQEVKASKKLCKFFAEETSLEKLDKVDAYTYRTIKGCKKIGVILTKEAIYKKVQSLPLFVINKGLRMQEGSSFEECALMKKKYN